MKSKILIICTGNSCRSQMAEGFLRSFDRELEVHSAGTNPELNISKYAVEVMKEIGIDIGSQYPKDVETYVNDGFDYVITVCDRANETCPVFSGKVKTRLHFSFEDPSQAKGSDEHIRSVYRKVRDLIGEVFKKFYKELREDSSMKQPASQKV